MATPEVDNKLEKPAKQPSARDPIMSVAKRNRDLEKRTQRALGSNIALALALLVSVVGNVAQGVRQVEHIYFVQNSDGSGITSVIPLTKPIASKAAVTQLVADAISNLNALDFANYKSQLNDASPFFTKTGWNRYMDEFVKSGTRDVIEKRQLVMNGAITKPPIIVSEGELFGALYWDVEVPYIVHYQGAGYDQQQTGTAWVKVVRVPVSENPKGMAIAQYIGKAS
jgi:hypothetical protein